nr:MAG TPA: nucleoside triphosphate pyrophosphohydrolase [Caudoviricetes sp.]
MTLIEQIANHYGLKDQCDQTIEEMAELTVALRKFWRYSGYDAEKINSLKYNITEEIADVGIMLDQLKILFDVEKDVSVIRAEKLLRQKERMKA